MFTVALIGPDGAGKSTIAHRLENSFSLPVKCLYMGINMESTNVSLPTSRFVKWVKNKRSKKARGAAANKGAQSLEGERRPRGSGWLWATLRLMNRLSEEWYRQLLSWMYQWRGRIVIYDRHYQFDFEYSRKESDGSPRRFTDWFHRWCLAKAYPRPQLVIYFDAPPEVLFARKGEGTLESLESRRQSFLRQGNKISNFVLVDATQPLDDVFSQVSKQILRFYELRRSAKKVLSELT
jgi:thymidylate kinase